MWWDEYIRYPVVLVLIILMAGCGWNPVIFQENDKRSAIRSGQQDGRCDGSENYIPWEENSLHPVRTIRVNFHFMDSRDGSYNLDKEDGIYFAERLVGEANKKLAENRAMRLPLNNNTPVLDPRIRYRLVTKENGDPAIYFHYDDDHFYLIKKGKHQNNYDRKVIEQYGVGLDSVLNVFVQVPPPEDLMPDHYGGLINGIALRNAIKISGPLRELPEVWRYSGMFNHEVGHILGLRHSWTGEQCHDTPAHSNCWNFTNDGSVCDSLVSNNVMDSNASQSALTPCQIGIMQSNLTRENGSGREFVDRDFCEKNSEAPYLVTDSLVWCMEKDITSDIRIRRGGYLEISNRISMSSDSGIYIEKGGRLVLKDGAILENACGYSWKGIFTKSNSEEGLIVEEGAVVRNILGE